MLTKVWEEDPFPEKGAGPKFCDEECCLRYRVQPVCGKCGNSSKKQMSCKEAPADPEKAKDWHCKVCDVRCSSRDASVWCERQ